MTEQPAILVYGLDPEGNKRAGRFDIDETELAIKAATLLGYDFIFLNEEVTVKDLPVGDVFARGPGLIPRVRRKRFETLLAAIGNSSVDGREESTRSNSATEAPDGATIATSDATQIKTARIRELNDQLRRKGVGGSIVITRGIEALGPDNVAAVLTAVGRFDDFTEDNDPWGEHDCAIVTVNEHRILFKIDYFDLDLQWHSPDASDPTVTKRVVTVMLAEEY